MLLQKKCAKTNTINTYLAALKYIAHCKGRQGKHWVINAGSWAQSHQQYSICFALHKRIEMLMAEKQR